MISIVSIVLHYLELIKLQLENKSFVSVIANVFVFVSLENTNVLNQVKMRLIWQLTKGISKVLLKLRKYFGK